MREFLAEHRALLYKRARTYVRDHAEKISGEDVAREIEIEIVQLAAAKRIAVEDISSVDALFKSLVKHACGRAKRRRKLIEQVAAGDDLRAVSDDLSTLDGDLPPFAVDATPEAKAARFELDRVKAELTPRDRLVFALLIEDDRTEEDVAREIAMPLSEVDATVDRIAQAARRTETRSLGADDPAMGAGGRGSEDAERRALFSLARIAAAETGRRGHTDEPLLAVLRSGDQAPDLDDALAHVAACADCRARLTDGELEQRSVVVVAIEAPRASHGELQKAADGAKARVVERGEGRFMAVVNAADAATFTEKLEKPESSVVSRLAAGPPFEVPVDDVGSPREKVSSIPDIVLDAGTDAAEASAWAQVARKAPQKVSGVSASWAAFAIAAIGTAFVIAYVLATR